MDLFCLFRNAIFPPTAAWGVKAGKIWMEYGALGYMECAGDDLKATFALSFTALAKSQPSETVMFSFITFKSKKHRDQVNAKAMKDPRLAAMCSDPKKMPFDCTRMAYGGFNVIIEG